MKKNIIFLIISVLLFPIENISQQKQTEWSLSCKKFTVDSLSNIYPHPFYVFVHYSHPPLIKRLLNLIWTMQLLSRLK